MDKDISVCFGTPYYMSGFGIENRVTELAKRLVLGGYRCGIACLEEKRVAPRGIEVFSLPKVIHLLTVKKKFHFTKFSNLIRSIFLKKFISKFDVFDAQYYPMTSIKIKKDIKKIITWHSVTFPEFAPNPVEGKIWNKEYRAMLKNMEDADLVIAVSKWAKEEILKHNDSIPVEVVYNGVDLQKFRFKPLNVRKKTIISLGRFTPHKGQYEVLKIYKIVLSELKDWNIKLILAGLSFDEG
ncbi:MAG: glycosyltransferase family 4 protein, partial [Candidatus Micrarchaeia archaeon]